MSEPEDFVICRICGGKFQQIQKSHLRTHKLTSEEYRKKYPDVPTSSKSLRKIISEKRREYYKDNPNALKSLERGSKEYWAKLDSRKVQSERRKRYFEDNPEARITIGKERAEYFKNPEARIAMSKVKKKYYRDNPEFLETMRERERERGKDPEVRKAISERRKKYLEDNPESLKNLQERMKEYWSDSESRKEKSENMVGKFKGSKNPAWKGGTSFLPYCHLFNKRKREEIRNKYLRTCIVSGISALQNGQRLCVDHVDENKMQGCDGIPWRLVPLSRCIHGRMVTPQNHLLLELLIYGNKQLEMNYMFPEEMIT